MKEKTTDTMIAEIRKMMGQADLFIRAEKTVSVDMMTVCPEKGINGASEVCTALGNEIFRIMHTAEFTDTVCGLYRRIDELEPLDRVMTKHLYTCLLKEKNISPEQNEENIIAKTNAWNCRTTILPF